MRAYTLRDLLREQEGAHLSNDVVLIGELIADQRAAGEPVDQEFLAEHRRRRPPGSSTSDPSGETIVVRGRRVRRATREGDDLSATASTDVGMITVSKEPEVVGDILGRDPAR